MSVVILATVLLTRLAPMPGCAPAYLTMDPDVRQMESTQFEVKIVEPDKRVRWSYDFIFSNRPCCQQTRNVVVDVVQRMKDRTATVHVGECR